MLGQKCHQLGLLGTGPQRRRLGSQEYTAAEQVSDIRSVIHDGGVSYNARQHGIETLPHPQPRRPHLKLKNKYALWLEKTDGLTERFFRIDVVVHPHVGLPGEYGMRVE